MRNDFPEKLYLDILEEELSQILSSRERLIEQNPILYTLLFTYLQTVTTLAARKLKSECPCKWIAAISLQPTVGNMHITHTHTHNENQCPLKPVSTETL